jgi:TIR domain/SIR2-like domain
MSNHLQDIISDIKKESCVLIVGPDIIDFGEKTFFEVMCDEFLTNDQYKDLICVAPQYIFVNDDLMQLQPNARETTILRIMEKFYQKQKRFEEPLHKISQIPFHLIISLLPDDRLRNVFKEQNLPFSYGYYPKEEAPVNVDKPTRENPLIYNLLGDFNEGDVIITFDHLFSFLTGIMGKREMPRSIQEALKKARTFVFLGVHFEKWYVQLLLRIITSKDRKEKYTILKNENDDTCTFIAKRLELDFLSADPLNFLNDLFNECKTQNLLKTVSLRSKAKVFISYSHEDKSIVNTIKERLCLDNIEVLMDDGSMPSGQKIEDFIQRIKEVDIVIPVLSKTSMLSPWVSKEIVTVKKLGKQLLCCYLDKAFLENDFYEKAIRIAVDNVQNINKSIIERETGKISDLVVERDLWIDYKENLPDVLKEIKKRKYCPVTEEGFENDLKSIITDIDKLMQL